MSGPPVNFVGSKHSQMRVNDGIHIIHAWTVADAAARLALVVDSFDVGKVAMQTNSSPPTFWVLANLPADWVQVGGEGSSVQPAVGLTATGTTATLRVEGVDVPLRAPNYLEIDVTLPPYNVQVAATTAAAGALAEADGIDQAIYDASLTGRAVRLPDGFYKKNKPILMRQKVSLRGPGQDRGGSYGPGQNGSWGLILIGGASAAEYGPTVDASAPNTSIKMWGATNHDGVMLNLTHAGLKFAKWPAYTFRALVRIDSLTYPGWICSTRGKIAASDTTDTLDGYLIATTGSVISTLTIWSATSLLALAAGSVPTITGGSIPDDIYFKIRCTGAGPRGDGTPGSGFNFQYSVNGGVSWVEELTSGATNALRGRLAGLTINWTNASSALTDSWVNYETKTLSTPAAKVAAGSNNYLITARWDGSVANGGTNTYTLHVNVAGAAYDASPQSTTFSLANGVVNKRIPQQTLLGTGANVHAYELGTDRDPLHFYLGSIGYWDTLQPLSGTSPTVMPNGTTTPKCYFIPQTGLANWGGEMRAPGDNMLWGWTLKLSEAAGSFVIFRRFVNSNFLGDFEIKDLGFPNGASRRSGILLDGPAIRYNVQNVTVDGGEFGFIHHGPGYEHDVGGLKLNCTNTDLVFINCDMPLSGTNTARGSGVNFFAALCSGRQTGTLWCNPGGAPYAGACLPVCSTLTFQNLLIDDEGCQGYTYAPLQLSIGQSCHIKGVLAVGNTQNTPVLIDSASAQSGIFIPDFGLQCHAGAKEVFSIIDTGVRPFELGPCFQDTSSVAPPLNDRVGYVRPYGGKQASQLTLTNADTTITATTPITTVTLPAGTLVATPKSFTLADANAKEGWEIRIACGVQAQNAVIKDGAAGTIETLTLGYRGTAVYRHNGTHFVFFG